ncbi:MAG: hypothetical protein U1F00_10965 [Rhodoferax sp.]
MPDTDALIRIAALCIVLAGAETLHGIARTVLVVPRIGKERALRWSALSGSLLAFAICLWLVPPIGLRGAPAHLALGLVLAMFMAAFDLAIGRWLMRKPWAKLWPDFDPRTGNYLSLGLAFLVCVPWLAASLRD